MERVKKRLGEMLVEAGLITEFQLSSALGHQKQWGGRIASILIDLGFVGEKSVASVLGKQLGQECISMGDRQIPPEALKKVKPDIAQKYRIMPLDLDKSTLTVAISDPTDFNTIGELNFLLGIEIKPLLAIESGIKNAINKHYYGITAGGREYTVDVVKLSEYMLNTNIEKDELDRSYLSKKVIEALIEVLTEESVKEELKNQILKKLRHSQS